MVDGVNTLVTDGDPLLGPLANNGGPTATHALLAGSPAIDAGSNPLGFQFDQRGVGFERESGAATDVGAFEVQFVDETAPQVESVVIDDGSGQRSVLRSVTVTFDSPVEIDPGAFEIANRDGQQVEVNLSTQLIGNQTVATLTFTGPQADASGSLLDGNYTLITRSDRIRDLSGNALDGNRDGVSGGNAVDEFYRLFGDADGDRDVDLFDFAAFRASFLRTSGDPMWNRAFDFDGDDDVDLFDFAAFRSRFRTQLAP
ncbi:MAG: Ig-like domain-containing protein [Pirellulales bacterium]|nr:Ig-like domain-containing protein [Pirellulales bacterium]